jgi:hypothetical protein
MRVVDAESGAVFQMQDFPSRPSALVNVPGANCCAQRGDYHARSDCGVPRLVGLGYL